MSPPVVCIGVMTLSVPARMLLRVLLEAWRHGEEDENRMADLLLQHMPLHELQAFEAWLFAGLVLIAIGTALPSDP